jgi:hypothetical protein
MAKAVATMAKDVAPAAIEGAVQGAITPPGGPLNTVPGAAFGAAGAVLAKILVGGAALNAKLFGVGKIMPADDGTGGGGGPEGPKTFGYMPSDDAGSPVTPHSFAATREPSENAPVAALRQVMPAPDDTGTGGPHSFATRSSNDVMPNPDDNSPGTPHSFGAASGAASARQG